MTGCLPNKGETRQTVQVNVLWDSASRVSFCYISSSSSSSARSSDGNSSLLNEGGSASQVPQASVELAGHGSVVWPDSLSEWKVYFEPVYFVCILCVRRMRVCACLSLLGMYLSISTHVWVCACVRTCVCSAMYVRAYS